MTDKKLSNIAKKRIGATKKERSERMREIAKIKNSKMSKAQKKKHGQLMRAAVGKNKSVV